MGSVSAREWQFDGIVGPTHNYAGLALGNLAASGNKGKVANPRIAALQGLEKMIFVRDLGMPQAFLPPHYRPLIGELRRLGFGGDIGMMLDSACRVAPSLLAAVYSSSFMWAANAATVTSSVDNNDGRLHLTTANLASHYHRAIEADFHRRSLRHIFHNETLFMINNYIRPCESFGDEGAANHMVINQNHHKSGTSIFVYGQSPNITFNQQKYPARQQRLASESIARLHGLSPDRCLFLQQSPEAIDRGVFHNDVIAMNTTSRMIIHQDALIPEHRNQLLAYSKKLPDFRLREVTSAELSVEEAVKTYFFNSQMLELPDRKFAIVAPSECMNNAAVWGLVSSLKSEGVLDDIHYLNLRESMCNGGGPACLRLRIVMTAEQEASFHQGVVLTDDIYTKLVAWVKQHYRDHLTFDDFRDPEFINELDQAYAAFEALVGIPDLYAGYRL